MSEHGPSWEEIQVLAESWKPPDGPVVLSAEYLRLVERAERLLANRPGTDKAWVERAYQAWKYDVEHSRRVRPE